MYGDLWKPSGGLKGAKDFFPIGCHQPVRRRNGTVQSPGSKTVKFRYHQYSLLRRKTSEDALPCGQPEWEEDVDAPVLFHVQPNTKQKKRPRVREVEVDVDKLSCGFLGSGLGMLPFLSTGFLPTGSPRPLQPPPDSNLLGLLPSMRTSQPAQENKRLRRTPLEPPPEAATRVVVAKEVDKRQQGSVAPIVQVLSTKVVSIRPRHTAPPREATSRSGSGSGNAPPFTNMSLSVGSAELPSMSSWLNSGAPRSLF